MYPCRQSTDAGVMEVKGMRSGSHGVLEMLACFVSATPLACSRMCFFDVFSLSPVNGTLMAVSASFIVVTVV